VRIRKYIKPWWNVSSHCDITSKSVKIQWYEVHCNVTSEFFCKMTWFLHECHILMCMEGNVRFTEIATLHEGYKGEIMKVGYTFACFMTKKTVFSQVIQLPTYKSIFFI
jgi:hypothetical protein